LLARDLGDKFCALELPERRISSRAVFAKDTHLDSIIDLIYETAVDPALWSSVISHLSREIDAPAVWMFRMQSSGPDFQTLQGLSTKMMKDYEEYFHSIDVLLEAKLRLGNNFIGRAFREVDMIGDKVWLNSGIYHDYARPNSMHHVLSMSLSSHGSHAGPFLTFFRPPGTDSFDDEAARRCDELLPHMSRALRQGEIIRAEMGALPNWTAALLDQLMGGVFLLDARGYVLHANSYGRSILNSRDGLALHNGRLTATDSATRPVLERIIGRCTGARPQGQEARLTRPAGIWLMSACPLSASSASGLAEGRCRAWVWVSDPSSSSRTLSQRLGALFGLTPAERRVAAALAENVTPADVAEQQEVSVATVRTQVQSIFAKLGVRRQAELARLLTEVALLPRH
jgi:DNA-binding CsgD family transcriptional regulator